MKAPRQHRAGKSANYLKCLDARPPRRRKRTSIHAARPPAPPAEFNEPEPPPGHFSESEVERRVEGFLKSRT